MMRLAASFLLCLAALSGARAGSVDAVEPGTPGTGGRLRWQNGESLPGEFAGASTEGLTWKSPLFDEGLTLDWSALRRFDQPLAARESADPFAFTLRDGSRVYGDLVAVTPEAVVIKSARHGDASLRRSEVLSARRLRGGNVLIGCPAGDVGWDLLTHWQNLNTKREGPGFQTSGMTGAGNSANAPTVPLLATGPGGSLVLPYWNTGVFHELAAPPVTAGSIAQGLVWNTGALHELARPGALPERLDMEFRVRSTRRPDFLISLECQPNQSLRITTWDGDLVLAQGEQFVKLAALADTERTASVRLCWDRATNHMSVYTHEGEPLADLFWAGSAQQSTKTEVHPLGDPFWSGSTQKPAKTDFHPAVVLLNKGRDLSLEFLRVRAWDGTPPPRLDGREGGVELADGRIVPGGIVSASAAGGVRTQLGGADAVVSFPLTQVDALVFSPDSPVPTADPPMTLTWADGTYLTGAVASIGDGRAVLQTGFTGERLSARLDGLRQLLLRAPTPKPDASPRPPPGPSDKFVAGDTAVHGRLICAGDDRPRWLPVGGLKAVLPARDAVYEIERALTPPQQEGQAAPVLLYTSAGDILPGRLRALDRTGLDFDSDLVETKKFAPADLHALQFDTAPHARIDGFTDPGWQVLKGNTLTVTRHDDTLTMEPGTRLGHPTAMQCSDFTFTLDPNNYCAVRMRMFCVGTDPARGVSLLCMPNGGGTLYYGLEASEGQLNSEQQANTGNGPVNVRVAVTERQVDFYVNGERLQSFPVAASRRVGSGLIIEPTSLWGNSVQTLKLSGFTARFVPGHVSVPEVNAEAKTQALTVPRFRQDDPPRQALIAANGDVLRGELEAATAGGFAFRAGLETFNVPRSRVQAAVWLKPPAEGPPPAAAGTAPRSSPLGRKIQLAGQYRGMGLRDVMGMLLQGDESLKVRYPKRIPARTASLRFDAPTLSEALDQICTAFGLRFRLEGNDTLVLEEAETAPAGMTRRMYWLKPDAVPKASLVREILSAKGIGFPDNSAVDWDPGSRQLVMTNTPENQRKLADVLRADFGGADGPNHWLMLANGARLGLAVDRFEPERIVGHHPVYGHCEVPLAAVYAIRTSSPEESVVMKGFDDWQLVSAPEPVLPEAGGDSSALVGKEAKAFKLPLLGGGEFDLAQEKGKVVVLDFWATWCGPCVQSLPGLIEAMSGFPDDRVRFVGLDQGEAAPQVKRFLETRGWKLTVAMDAAQNVGRQFGADAIPLTVVIGPDGKVAWVRNGYQPGGEEEITETIKKLLAGAAK